MTTVISAGPAPAPDIHLRRYPVHVTADACPDRPSRGLWLVKWLLVLPHLLVLLALWTAFAVLTVVALVAVLVTGRYPRAIFDFNVGVLRWSWRVAYYSYGAVATDRYPPFSLHDDPTYPAHLDVDHPGRLSRGLALVKWWLLAIPHYLVLAFFTGPVLGEAAEAAGAQWRWEGGLVAVLVLVAGVALLATGRYPQGLYDLLLGLHRWIFRVVGYAALMTDAYPPFRLEQGGPETPAEAPVRAPDGPRSRWTTGTAVTVVVGALAVVTGLGLVGGGAAVQTWRDDGFVTTPGLTVRTDGYAVVTGEAVLRGTGLDLGLGDVRVRAEADDGEELFLGVGRAADVKTYLADVGRTVLTPPLWDGDRDVDGGAPAVAPQDADVWLASTTGPGQQSVEVAAQPGTWVAVVMPADLRPGLGATVDAGATLPWLTPLGLVVVALGAVLALGGAAAVALGVRAAGATR